jgi:hypothetical protein
MAIDRSCQVQRQPLAERGADLYFHPARCGRGVVARPFAGTIWEPAAGRGAIVNVLRSRGFDVLATDLVDYGIPEARRDFLMETELPPGVMSASSRKGQK